MFILRVSNMGYKHKGKIHIDNIWQHEVASEMWLYLPRDVTWGHATTVTRYSTAFIIASFYSLTQTYALIQSITVTSFVALRHVPDAQFFFLLHFKRHTEQNLDNSNLQLPALRPNHKVKIHNIQITSFFLRPWTGD